MAKLCCLHCIEKGIGSIKLSDKEVAGSDRLVCHISDLAGALGGELHALVLITVFYHHGRIFLRLCRWVADIESRVSGSPDVEEITIPVFLPVVVSLADVCVFEIEFKLLAHGGLSLLDVYLIGAAPLLVF